MNAVAPGTIATAVWRDQPEGAERMRHHYPLGWVGQPADVAAAVAHLASATRPGPPATPCPSTVAC